MVWDCVDVRFVPQDATILYLLNACRRITVMQSESKEHALQLFYVETHLAVVSTLLQGFHLFRVCVDHIQLLLDG